MRTLARALGYLRADPARAWFAGLLLADIALIWALPVLVGQDLPQHLSYARILADHDDPRLAFREVFALPAHAQPYFTAYLLLVPLIRWSSVLTACRIVYTAYAVATALGFAALVTAVRETTEARRTLAWTSLLGPLLVWNPVQCVGFLPFMLAIPGVLVGAALVVRRQASRGATWPLALWSVAAVTTSLHLIAGVSLVLVAGLFALFRQTWRSAWVASSVAAATAITTAAWHALGQPDLAELPVSGLLASMRRNGLLHGLVTTLGVRWSSAETKGAFVTATILGPLPSPAKLAVGLAGVGLFLLVLRSRSAGPARLAATPSRKAFGLAVLAFAAIVVATPTAIRLPDDVCLLDFRLYVLAFMLALALLPWRAFERPRAQAGLALFASFVLLVWSRQLWGAAEEANAVVRLTARLEPTDTLLALPFHDRSEFLDEDNSVTHYFPVYNTAIHGGLTSLFWGKFSHHLPVGYEKGREIARPPDWDPSQFTRAELVAASHVLVEWPDAADGDPPATGAARLRSELASGFRSLGCEGRWCLFATTSVSLPGEEARR